ncbi:MAG TPA: protein kinase [Pirellulales bacterium]|nr:protein kinase [Pirellulales bacterium]
MSQSSSSEVRITSPGDAMSPGGERPPAPASSPPHADDRTVISDRPPLQPTADGSRPPLFEFGKLVAGDRLGHFELLEYVGGGGMGAVFRARDTMLDREVALKVLSRAQGADDETRRRFHVEAQSAARLDHQNIARVYYVGEDQGLNFIVFEFIRGENIRDLVERQGSLSVGDAVSFTLQIAEALTHACQRNVVHRDIKPSNIIVTGEGRAKLVDMGLARLHARTANDDLTASGVTLGTFDYISPEQARDPRMADVRSDIYSLGCTLYYMLTARPPFPEGTVLQKLLQHQADEVPDPRQINPEIPDEIAALLRRMLAKDPRQRFQEPGELIAELLVVADRLDLRPVTTGQFWIAPQQGLAFWERHLPWIAPVAALVLIVLGVEWFGSSSAPPGLTNPEDPRVGVTRATPPANVIPVDGPKARAADVAVAGGRSLENPSTSRETRAAEESVQSQAPGQPIDEKIAAEKANADDAAVVMPDAVAGKGDDSSTVDRPTSRIPRVAENANTPVTGNERAANRSAAVRSAADNADVAATETRNSDVRSSQARAAEAPAAPTVVSVPEPGSAAPAVPSGGVAILSVEGGERKQFASLKAACSAAKNNDVIELQFNGVREQEPLELANLRLTIRAGAGFRPVLAFRPAQFGPGVFGRSMINVTGGRLTFLNVGLLLDIAREATADGWSLFETRQAEQLRFEGCSLTIRNPGAAGSGYHDNVSFFDVKAAPGLDTMMKTPESPQIHPLNLDLQNCIARGEAVFIHSADAQPLALDWDNGLLAVSDSLLLAEGSSSSPPPGERVEIRLNHLTAVANDGLIRLLAASDVPYLLKTEVSCANSFLVTRGSPLVEQRGPQRTAMLEQQFQWSGDRNFCQGFSVFWQLVDTNASNAPRLVSEAQWQAQMGQGDNLLRLQERIWKRGAADDRPASALRREDFVLADRLRGPGGPYEASDMGDVGMDSRRLPDLPAEPLPLLGVRELERPMPRASGER